MGKIFDPSARIGIIGAGPAGITAAHFLQKKGYSNLFLIEREAAIGGKCHTIHIEGQCYELGGGIHNASYIALKEMIQDCRIQYAPFPVNFKQEGIFIDFDQGLTYNDHRHLKKYSRWKCILGSLKFMAEVWRFKRHYQNGFLGVGEEYYLPFSDWLRQKQIPVIEELISWFTTGFGYGYFSEVPALYVLKYMLSSLPPFVIHHYEINDIGYQGLWEAIAKRFTIYTSTSIRTIRRGVKTFIETPDRQFWCDYLIIACPLDNMLNVLDTTESEYQLFSKIHYYDYHALCSSLDRPLPRKLGLVVNRLSADYAGGVLFYYKHWENRNICMTYHLGHRSIGMQNFISQSIVEDQLRLDMAHIDRRVQAIHLHKIWKYFPHVTTQELAAGFYAKLDRLQGEKKTYYTGEIFNFASVGGSTNYSKFLINQFF